MEKAESAKETPSAFSISQEEIDAELRRGSLVSDRRGRIFNFYQNGHTAQEARKFLKEEYGTSGHSHTYLDGSSGFVDYRPSQGVRFVRYDPRFEQTVSWTAIEARIRLMIHDGVYLSPEEMAQYAAVHLESDETAPEEDTETPAEYIPQRETPSDHADEMLRQAEQAYQISEETGQNVFAFEEGNPLPVNVTAPEVPAENADPLAPPYHVGDTVYLEDTAFLITEIRTGEVQLRDPTLN